MATYWTNGGNPWDLVTWKIFDGLNLKCVMWSPKKVWRMAVDGLSILSIFGLTTPFGVIFRENTGWKIPGIVGRGRRRWFPDLNIHKSARCCPPEWRCIWEDFLKLYSVVFGLWNLYPQLMKKTTQLQGCRFGSELKPNPGNQYLDPQVQSVVACFRKCIRDTSATNRTRSVDWYLLASLQSTLRWPTYAYKLWWVGRPYQLWKSNPLFKKRSSDDYWPT